MWLKLQGPSYYGLEYIGVLLYEGVLCSLGRVYKLYMFRVGGL